MQVNDLRVVRASDLIMDKLSTELRDVTAGHVVPGHVFAADLHVRGAVRLTTTADTQRYIWLNKYQVPHKQVLTHAVFLCGRCIRLTIIQMSLRMYQRMKR